MSSGHEVAAGSVRVAAAIAATSLGAPDGTAPVALVDAPERYLFFTAPLVREGVNGNHDVFLAEELARAWPTIIGQPLDLDHDFHVPGAVGKLVDARLVREEDGLVLWVTGAIHTGYFPEVAYRVREGIVRGVSMECLFERAQQTLRGRVLKDLRFIGGALTRTPADAQALVHAIEDGVRPSLPTTATARRRRLLLAAAAAAAAAAW